MRRLGPCKIIFNYGNNAYKIELPTDLGLSPIFNVANLVAYKGPTLDANQSLQDVKHDVANIQLSLSPPLQVEMILYSRVYKQTRKNDYLEHLVVAIGEKVCRPFII